MGRPSLSVINSFHLFARNSFCTRPVVTHAQIVFLSKRKLGSFSDTFSFISFICLTLIYCKRYANIVSFNYRGKVYLIGLELQRETQKYEHWSGGAENETGLESGSEFLNNPRLSVLSQFLL